MPSCQREKNWRKIQFFVAEFGTLTVFGWWLPLAAVPVLWFLSLWQHNLWLVAFNATHAKILRSIKNNTDIQRDINATGTPTTATGGGGVEWSRKQKRHQQMAKTSKSTHRSHLLSLKPFVCLLYTIDIPTRNTSLHTAQRLIKFSWAMYINAPYRTISMLTKLRMWVWKWDCLRRSQRRLHSGRKFRASD